jgi:nucleotide-binding universal stress UspA family protein
MKILLAIDDSKFSEAAVQNLIEEFKPGNTEVCVFTVVESLALATPAYTYGAGPIFPQDYTDILNKWRTEARGLVERTAKTMEAAGFRASFVVGEGEARTAILEQAERWRPDLIILGSHGRSGFDRFLLGSVSEGIARHARCSVQIARQAA